MTFLDKKKQLENTEVSFTSKTLARARQKAALESAIRKIQISLELAKLRLGQGFDLQPTAVKKF